jgi:hypothetical protein
MYRYVAILILLIFSLQKEGLYKDRWRRARCIYMDEEESDQVI